MNGLDRTSIRYFFNAVLLAFIPGCLRLSLFGHLENFRAHIVTNSASSAKRLIDRNHFIPPLA